MSMDARQFHEELRATALPALLSECMHAKLKFPGNRYLLAALTEEVGELAQALLQKQGPERVREEALQVACVTLRIAIEGDATFTDITDEEAKP